MNEPKITINGTELSVGEAMTVRVALESFASTLSEMGLGDDDHGRRMCAGYLAHIQAIRLLIFSAV